MVFWCATAKLLRVWPFSVLLTISWPSPAVMTVCSSAVDSVCKRASWKFFNRAISHPVKSTQKIKIFLSSLSISMKFYNRKMSKHGVSSPPLWFFPMAFTCFVSLWSFCFHYCTWLNIDSNLLQILYFALPSVLVFPFLCNKKVATKPMSCK